MKSPDSSSSYVIFSILLTSSSSLLRSEQAPNAGINNANPANTADIIIAAVGKAKFVKASMVRDGAVVIDVGVNRDEVTGKLCGDVDFKDVEPKASYITKVPGGIGPMTITCLMENTLECYLKHMEDK